MPESPTFHTIALLGFPQGSDVAASFVASGRRVVESAHPDRDALAQADLVVEAGQEDLQQTRDALAVVSQLVAEDVPIVTAASVLSVTDVASAVDHPERVAGLHFFNGG